MFANLELSLLNSLSHEGYCILNINRIDVVEEDALSQIWEDPTLKGGTVLVLWELFKANAKTNMAEREIS